LWNARCRSRKEQTPAVAIIVRTEKPACARIDDPWIDGIKSEGVNPSPYIELAPGLASVVRNIRARHVAGDQDCARIVRADGWNKLRAAPTWPNNLPLCRGGRGATNRTHSLK